MSDISTRIKDLRNEKNLKQQQLADCLGISQQSYSHYEQGKRELPIRHVRKLAEFYEVSTDYILGTSPYRAGSFDPNSDYVDDISLGSVLSALDNLNETNRQAIIHFLSYLEVPRKK